MEKKGVSVVIAGTEKRARVVVFNHHLREKVIVKSDLDMRCGLLHGRKGCPVYSLLTL
jgi:hypothetical protein